MKFMVSEITHFGQKYTHQGTSTDQSLARTVRSLAGRSLNRTRRSSPFESLTKDVLEGLYRHYWLDFVLLGYGIPEELQ